MPVLKRLRQSVLQKADAVERDKAQLAIAVDRTYDRLRRDASRPVTLLALFAAGLLFGAVRGGGRDGDSDERRKSSGGMLSRTAAVLLSAARLIELTRQADRFSPGAATAGRRPEAGSD